MNESDFKQFLMKVFPGEQVLPCDIDGTIISWDLSVPGRKIAIPSPYIPGLTFDVKVHEPHVRLIRERLARGATFIAWSAGGYQWARAVFVALDLDHPNIHVYSKPIAYLDDLSCEKWMGDRIFLPFDSHWRIKADE